MKTDPYRRDTTVDPFLLAVWMRRQEAARARYHGDPPGARGQIQWAAVDGL